MSYKILNIDNMQYQTEEQADLIFCDFVYEDLNFQWVDKYWRFLKEGGVWGSRMCGRQS
jgi:hypothetical protein